VAYGFLGAAGAAFRVASNLDVFAELEARAVSWAPTQVKYHGVTTLQDSYSFSGTGTQNVDLKPVLDLNSLQIKIGVNCHL
jgi:hypothetical protein